MIRLAGVWIGFVGNSPLLRIREGSIESLGAQDSLVDRLVREGVITREEARPLALMPDAHLGAGSTVGAVLLTHGIIPAAVGVDIGCGMSAFKTNIKRHEISDEAARRILGWIRETIPSGVGKAHSKSSELGKEFVKWRGWPSIDEEKRIPTQFGTLGSGNHFAEVSEDLDGFVWVLVHSGFRGTGNLIAQRHINVAKSLGIEVENAALSYLSPGTSEPIRGI